MGTVWNLTHDPLYILTEVSCADPGVVSDATVNFSGTGSYGENRTWTCDSGFEPHLGNFTRTCLESGCWSGSSPTCQGNPFSSNSNLEHGTNPGAKRKIKKEQETRDRSLLISWGVSKLAMIIPQKITTPHGNTLKKVTPVLQYLKKMTPPRLLLYIVQS